jgi:hypothetical protein
VASHVAFPFSLMLDGTMKNLTIKVLVLFTITCQSGCFYLSSRVSSVGMRSTQVGERVLIYKQKKNFVNVEQYSLVTYGKGHGWVYFPYSNYGNYELIDKSKAEVDHNYEELRASKIQILKIIKDNKGISLPVNSIFYDDERSELNIYAAKHERKWYGYPAQLLMPPAIIGDIIIDIFILPILIFQ